MPGTGWIALNFGTPGISGSKQCPREFYGSLIESLVGRYKQVEVQTQVTNLFAMISDFQIDTVVNIVSPLWYSTQDAPQSYQTVNAALA
jgi:hypothetical protein